MNAIDQAEAGLSVAANVTDEVGIIDGGLAEGRSSHLASFKEGIDLGQECCFGAHD